MKKLCSFLLVFLVLAAIAPAQDGTLDPTFGSIELESGFWPDPYIIEMLAGGSIDLELTTDKTLRAINPYGFVADAPDLDLYFEATGGLPLIIRVEGFGEDTVLLINDPEGNWHFNDDYNDYDPKITFMRPVSGLYSIWVGTFWDGDYLDVDLVITELD